MRASNSGRKLNDDDAALVKAMIERGDRQHDIASVFAVNGGRIGETSTGEHFAHVSPASAGVPPRAPYLVVDAKLRAKAKTLQGEVLSGHITRNGREIINEIVQAFDESHGWRRGK